ncbi:MAG: FtsX-like permease family protein [Dehalococcoidia bacterium]
MEDLKAMMIPLIVIFTLFIGVIAVLAWRNKVVFKMGARNLPRRPANTLLTCLGLMLAAMIFSASFATGDTLTHSIRSVAVDYLGQVDVMVMGEGAEFGGQQHTVDGRTQSQYFDQSRLKTTQDALQSLSQQGTVEGIAPAIIENNIPVVAPETSLNEPQVSLLGFDYRYMQAFDPLVEKGGSKLSLETLQEKGPGYIYINTGLAEALSDQSHAIAVGDQIEIYLSQEATPLTIAGIYETGGNPTVFNLDVSASMVMPLAQVQALRGSEEINLILITNRGGAITGADHTDAVMAALQPALAGTGVKAEPVKQDALDDADEGGAMFSTVFLVFGSFSIIVGVLLIFLIFVMLAAERKQELGMTRAIGGQRGHIIRLFTFEGTLYAVAASAIGAALGLLVAWGMIQMMNAAFEEWGFDLTYHYTPSGLIISYTLGVILTALVVFFSARRVSQLNIISAIKDIPESKQTDRHRIRSIAVAILAPLVGLLMLTNGLQEKISVTYTLGASLLIIGICLLARKFRLPDRPAFTLAGLGLLAFWLIPFDWHPYHDEMSGGMEMFILSGVMLVLGAVWTVMYNSDLLLSAVMSVFGRIRALAPILKPAVSYPMVSRFRTGMAVAMFSMVIFTLVVMAVINASFNNLLDDTRRVSGGFDIRAEVFSDNRLPDIQTALAQTSGVSADDFQAIAAFNIAPAYIRDASRSGGSDDASPEWELLPLVGTDTGYTDNVTYDFQLVSEKYYRKGATSREVWQALTANPNLAVVNSALVPTRETGDFGSSGIELVVGKDRFYLQDKFMPDDIYVEIQNPVTKATQKLQVIGVVDPMSGPYGHLVTTSQQTVNAIAGVPLLPSAYRFMVKPDRSDAIPQLAKSLEQNFEQNGMNSEVMADEVKDYGKINNMFMNLMMAFMGLGLIVGIAALGVIAARSVVERRHQIGMLRAIGFRQGMVQLSFLLESSFIALLGITLGVILGVALAYQLIPDWDIEGMTTTIPWLYIVLITVGAYLASLTTTFLPAYRAAKVYPAEALRYE